jgi:hypothetical protein
MAIKNPLSIFSRKTLGYGKSGSNPYQVDEKHDYRNDLNHLINKVKASHSLETQNLSRENLEVIMKHIGEIVSKKDRYSPLNRYDREKFNHLLEEEFRHGKLTREDIKDAWSIWENFSHE